MLGILCGLESEKKIAGKASGAISAFAIREGGRTVGAGAVTEIIE